MLSLNLATIRTAHERIEQVYEPEALPGKGDSFGTRCACRLATDVYKDKDQFRLVGHVQTTLELSCGVVVWSPSACPWTPSSICAFSRRR